MVLFLLFPLMHHMGFSYYQYFRYFTKVFAEPVAYTIFLLALVRIIYFYKKSNAYSDTLPFTCLLLTISCILRPNLSSSSFFLLLFPLFYLIQQKNYKILTYFIFAGLTIFLPLFHNLYFGKSFVLFTGAVFTDANIKITLRDYFQLLSNFEISYEKRSMMIEMFKNFFNPFEVHKYFIVFGIIISLRIVNLKNNILIPLYIVIFTQLYLFSFLIPVQDIYGFLAMCFSVIFTYFY